MADSAIPPVVGSVVGGWLAAFNTVISLINGRFASRPYVWSGAGARLAQTGMTVGEYGYQTDTQVTYRAISATTTQAWSSPWITYTATPASGMVIGTGGSATTSGKYKYEHGLVRVHFLFTLGSSGASLSASPTIPLPVAAATPDTPQPIYPGSASAYDVAPGNPYALVLASTSSSTTQFRIFISGTNGAYTGLSATVPFTWAAGDSLQGEFVYSPA